MARHTISHADEIFRGNAFFAPYSPDGRRGVQFDHLVAHEFGAPVALDVDALVAAATGAELPNGDTIVYTFADDGGTSPLNGAVDDGVLDVARNVTAAATHATSIVAMDIVVTGLDAYGQTISELLVITATGTSKSAAGKKAFKSITSIAITSAGNATTNTLNMGFGNVLGLPFRVPNKGRVIAASVDGVAESCTLVVGDTTAPTTATGDVRGTIAFNTATDGTKRMSALLKVDSSTKEAAFGINPS